MSGRQQSQFVYEMVDLDGNVLYVGRTTNVHQRIMGHKSKPWWPAVAHYRVTPCATRLESFHLERHLIGEHRPPHNVMNNPSALRAERGSMIDAVLATLSNGPMSTTELRSRINYPNTPTIVKRLHDKGLIKAVGWIQVGCRSGYMGVWARADHPYPAAPHPVAQVAA